MASDGQIVKRVFALVRRVELRGLEPLTPTLPVRYGNAVTCTFVVVA
jgi:hypothetical protein